MLARIVPRRVLRISSKLLYLIQNYTQSVLRRILVL